MLALPEEDLYFWELDADEFSSDSSEIVLLEELQVLPESTTRCPEYNQLAAMLQPKHLEDPLLNKFGSDYDENSLLRDSLFGSFQG